jgi:phage replication-related protein YjqB (UPF0714/DUF867 family)
MSVVVEPLSPESSDLQAVAELGGGVEGGSTPLAFLRSVYIKPYIFKGTRSFIQPQARN